MNGACPPLHNLPWGALGGRRVQEISVAVVGPRVVLGPAPSPAWGTPCPPAQSALGGTQGGRRVLTACSLHSGLYPHYGPQSKMDL